MKLRICNILSLQSIILAATSLSITSAWGVGPTAHHSSIQSVDNESKGAIGCTHTSKDDAAAMNRRKWMQRAILSTTAGVGIFQSNLKPARADYDDDDDDDNDYDNPNMPGAPEERSGLVVLRVAEVCNFQEKILRAVVSKDIDTVVSPQQIVFGNKLLLKNSNIAGNMKLMIETEIPRNKRKQAAANAVKTMNTIQSISVAAGKIERPFTDEEMISVANLYLDARLQLNSMYEYLPQAGKDKYNGYFMQVTEYEKKIAEGVYNPELDGVLKLDY